MSSAHFAWLSTASTDRPMIFVLRLSNSGFSIAIRPSSVVQTGVKSLGCEKSTAHESPIQSWKLIFPSVVSASKSGAVSPIVSAMWWLPSKLDKDSRLLLLCLSLPGSAPEQPPGRQLRTGAPAQRADARDGGDQRGDRGRAALERADRRVGVVDGLEARALRARVDEAHGHRVEPAAAAPAGVRRVLATRAEPAATRRFDAGDGDHHALADLDGLAVTEARAPHAADDPAQTEHASCRRVGLLRHG